jgi:GNAT superfamily N-acetyltransferase
LFVAMSGPEYRVSTDPQDMQLDVIHDYLARSYWAAGIPRDTVERAVANSLCFGLFQGEAQVGFARIITDRATFAYLADVFVLEEHRGQGLSKRLMTAITRHPDLQGLRRWMLATRDAHGLYAQFGFRPLKDPERFMELHAPDVYALPFD